MDKLTPVKKILDRILAYGCIFFCGVMVFLVSYQVAARFILHDPSSISEELARICFVWMGLLAAALLYGEKDHMNINFIPEKMGPKGRQYLRILSETATLFMAVWVLSYGGFRIAANNMVQTNAAMPYLPVGIVYSIVPIAGVCITFYAIYNILEAMGKLRALSAVTGGKPTKEGV